MFKKVTTEPTALDQEISRLHLDIYTLDKASPKYVTMVDQLVKLYAIKERSIPKGVSADVKATILANLAGILVIVGHEKANVISSKALGFIQKLR